MLRCTELSTLTRIWRESRKNSQVPTLFSKLMIFLDKDLEDIGEYLEIEWEHMDLEEKKVFLKELDVKPLTQWQKFRVNNFNHF